MQPLLFPGYISYSINMFNLKFNKISKFTIFALVAVVGITACVQNPEASFAEITKPIESTQEEGGGVAHETPDPVFLAEIEAMRSPDVPDLPFPDNPDPSLCGIPTQWGPGGTAWLSGIYQGELIQSDVLLYDSHLRLNITAQAPHGSEVEILLFQQNPVTDYYMVKIKGAETPNEGWIPEHFLSFEPVESIN
jgi:hypothetical protein